VEILAYCRLVGVDHPDTREMLAHRLRALDAEYLDWFAARAARRSDRRP
jgi:hypothetical protein